MKEQPEVAVTLWAPDIQPKHCCIQRLQFTSSDLWQNDRKGPGATVIKPLPGALVKRNGAVINQEVELHSGDVIGLGENYLFMFKDPNTEILENSPSVGPPWLPDPPKPHPPTSFPLYQTCMLSRSGGPGTPCAAESTLPCLRDTNGQELILFYDVKHETRVLEEIFTKIDRHEDLHKLALSFLMCLCLQQSATHFPMNDLRRLLLHLANEGQIAVLVRFRFLVSIIFNSFRILTIVLLVFMFIQERAKELAAIQSEM